MDVSIIVVITDDFSRFSWVFFLEMKDETTKMLMDFFTQVENVYEKKVKRIRSDNGTEFKNHALNVFCLSKSIQHHFSAPYEPQQNGVAERKNRTLIEAARTTLADSKCHTPLKRKHEGSQSWVPLHSVIDNTRQNIS